MEVSASANGQPVKAVIMSAGRPEEPLNLLTPSYLMAVSYNYVMYHTMSYTIIMSSYFEIVYTIYISIR